MYWHIILRKRVGKKTKMAKTGISLIDGWMIVQQEAHLKQYGSLTRVEISIDR